mgnify:CR=1 FL=1
MRRAEAGDLVLLAPAERDRRFYIRTLTPGGRLNTNRGELAYDDVIGQPFGTQVASHLGQSFYLLTPTTEQLVIGLQRKSQIIFPKDSGYIIMKLGIVPGVRVLEAGTGSGGLCLAFASIVGEGGHVYSYDAREDLQRVARRNIEGLGLRQRVTFKLREVGNGFDEAGLDAVFLDLREPWSYLDQARGALRGGGALGVLVPTANQLVATIRALHQHLYFGFIEAEELLLRSYRTVPDRVRPDDQMIGHTGFLVFARAVLPHDHEAHHPVLRRPDDSD